MVKFSKKKCNQQEKFMENLFKENGNENNINKNDNDRNCCILEDFFEWEIENFDSVVNGWKVESKYSPRITSCKQQWRIELYSSGNLTNDDKHFEVHLTNLNLKSEKEHICSKINMYFSNYKNFNKIKAYPASYYCFGNTDIAGYGGYQNKIYANDYNRFIKPLIQDGKIVIGFYIKIYSEDLINSYICNIKSSLKQKNVDSYEFKGENYHEWTIDNWEYLKPDWNISPTFIIGNYQWQVYLKPKNENGYISLMLYNSNYYSLKKDENVYIQCVFCVRNSIDLFNYKIKSALKMICFNKKENKYSDEEVFKLEDIIDESVNRKSSEVSKNNSKSSKNKNSKNNNYLIENDNNQNNQNKSILVNSRLIFGFYISVYKGKADKALPSIITTTNKNESNTNPKSSIVISPAELMASKNENDYIITPKDMIMYDQQFNKLSKENQTTASDVTVSSPNTPFSPYTPNSLKTNSCSYVTNEQCMKYFQISELSNQDLEEIWYLADIDHNNSLIREEFYIAMHLIRLKKNGSNLPEILPDSLIPPTLEQRLNFQKSPTSYLPTPIYTFNNHRASISNVSLAPENGPQTPTVDTPTDTYDNDNLVIAQYNFKGEENSDEMNIQKGDLLIVIDWNFDDGWVSGYHKNNPSKIGIFPRNYVCKYDKSKKDFSLPSTPVVQRPYKNINNNFYFNSSIDVIHSPKPEPTVLSPTQLKLTQNIYSNQPSELLQPQSPLNENENNNVVIALYNFIGGNKDELSFEKGEQLVVTNWNVYKGWLRGYKVNNKDCYGIFPKSYIRQYQNKNTLNIQADDNIININNNEKESSDLVVATYDFKGKNPDDLEFHEGDEIIVTQWELDKKGWAYGYINNNESSIPKKGRFPVAFVEEENNYQIIAIHDYKSCNSYELDIHEGDHLQIIDWNAKDGWTYGYIENQPQKKGFILKLFIKKIVFQNSNKNKQQQQLQQQYSKGNIVQQ